MELCEEQVGNKEEGGEGDGRGCRGEQKEMAERKRRLTDASDIAVIGHSILEEGMSSSAEIELNEEKK